MKHNLPKIGKSIHRRKFFLLFLIFLLFFSTSFLLSLLYFGKLRFPLSPSPFPLSPSAYPRVPEPNDQVQDKNIAVPQSASTLFENDTGKRRSFQINLENGRFSVEKIAVYQNDIVNIRITAGDRDYDFTIPDLGIRQEAQKGQTRMAEFQAVSTGTFEFRCPSCGNGAKGLLIIVPNNLTKKSSILPLTNLSHLSYDENDIVS